MFFTAQIDEIITDERKAYRSYLIWLISILTIGVLFIATLIYNKWYTDLGPTLSSLFILFLSKPPFTEMLKRKEKIKTLNSLKRMALITDPESREAAEIEKLVISLFKNLLKA